MGSLFLTIGGMSCVVASLGAAQFVYVFGKARFQFLFPCCESGKRLLHSITAAIAKRTAGARAPATLETVVYEFNVVGLIGMDDARP
jgi:hypothetical protein